MKFTVIAPCLRVQFSGGKFIPMVVTWKQRLAS